MLIEVKSNVRGELDVTALVSMEIAERMHKQSEKVHEILKALNSMAAVIEFDAKYIQELKAGFLTVDQQKSEMVLRYEEMRAELSNKIPQVI